MVDKKLSGQTIVIIILVVILILLIAFGGVYAYYSTRSSQITGFVTMANLSIQFKDTQTEGSSGSSEILITNSYVMAGQVLTNTPLIVLNGSNNDIYIVVVYSVTTKSLDGTASDIDPINSNIAGFDTSVWTDYAFVAENGEDSASFRCLISLTPFSTTDEEITVIGENSLQIPKNWGNEYQNMMISFKFQAYAIGSNPAYGTSYTSLKDEVEAASTTDEKCNLIASAVWEAFDYNITI